MKPATEKPAGSSLRPELSAGQMAMVAVGGSIGTGLLLGSGAAIQIAGPAVVLSFMLGGIVAFAVTMALGELACRHPGAGSFGIYADLYLSEWAGFVSRYGYWFSISISISAELVASATYARFWFPQTPPLLWVASFGGLLLFINLREVKNFGSFEYWFAMVKLVTIAVFIVLGAGLLLKGRVASHYVSDGGFMPHGASGPLLAISFALFSFLGTEMVAISSGEAVSVRAIAKATYRTFGLVAFVYIGSIAVLAGVLPWSQAGVGQSPFVTVFAIDHPVKIVLALNPSAYRSATIFPSRTIMIARVRRCGRRRGHPARPEYRPCDEILKLPGEPGRVSSRRSCRASGGGSRSGRRWSPPCRRCGARTPTTSAPT